jgi:hypothetical protein
MIEVFLLNRNVVKDEITIFKMRNEMNVLNITVIGVLSFVAQDLQYSFSYLHLESPAKPSQ